MSSEAIIDIASKTECYVINRDSLLHCWPWKLGDSYGTKVQSYLDFTLWLYGLATAVFDGSDRALSIKDSTHKNMDTISIQLSILLTTEFSGKNDYYFV